jgi:hypothetical protein
MNRRVNRRVFGISLGIFLAAAQALAMVAGLACSRRSGASGAASAPTGGAPPHAPVPGDVNCYQLAGARACPPDSHDPSGKNLPSPGSTCSLGACAVCGSATAPAFRDFNGVSRPGWCICVETSDGSGSIYSCFGTEEWPKR